MSPISPVPFDVRGLSWLGLDLATFKLIERGYVLAGTQLVNEIAAVKLGLIHTVQRQPAVSIAIAVEIASRLHPRRV